jgi:hypothetical protein
METKEKYLLSTLDRCDRCSAQAWVIVKGLKGNLYFCSHHFEKHSKSLVEWAYDIVDERHRLTEN